MTTTALETRWVGILPWARGWTTSWRRRRRKPKRCFVDQRRGRLAKAARLAWARGRRCERRGGTYGAIVLRRRVEGSNGRELHLHHGVENRAAMLRRITAASGVSRGGDGRGDACRSGEACPTASLRASKALCWCPGARGGMLPTRQPRYGSTARLGAPGPAAGCEA